MEFEIVFLLPNDSIYTNHLEPGVNGRCYFGIVDRRVSVDHYVGAKKLNTNWGADNNFE